MIATFRWTTVFSNRSDFKRDPWLVGAMFLFLIKIRCRALVIDAALKEEAGDQSKHM